ncbi:MAG: fimbrillin family protein [Bacteroidales bacterium]|nr:fimbrillin family protein [Bacteroidales bacterium]
MKKLLFAALAFAAVACSKSEVVEQPSPLAIGFDSPFIENSTKATDLTTGENGTLQDFGVYGYVEAFGGIIFNNENVSKTGPAWTYANTQYWVAEKPYYFTAIAPASQGGKYTPTEVNAGTINFDNTSADIDLLYAYTPVAAITGPITAQPDPVKFSFNHILSRVKFSFKNEMVAENAKITISNVAITDAYKTGTATITDGALASWTPADPTNTVSFAGIDNAIEINTEGETDHMYFIPANKTYTLTFTVALTQGTVAIATKTHTVTIPAVDMQAGFSYDFKAVLNEANVVDQLFPITFTAEATPWADFSEVTPTVPVQ